MSFLSLIWNNPATRWLAAAAAALTSFLVYGMARERAGREMQKVEEKQKDVKRLLEIEDASLEAARAAERVRLKSERLPDKPTPDHHYRD